MADVQKPVEVPAAAPVTTDPAVTEPVAPATETTAPVVEAPKTEEIAAPATEEAKAEEAVPVAAAEEKTVEPVEAGTLEHKGAPASFPKNIIYSKNHFFFGSEPIAADKLSAYQKGEKVAETAQHVISWAAHTGKGLLFITKENDKSTPVGAIQLAEASEPATDGANKFHFTSKGNKHTFKASSTAERDNWVSQLKLKIAEAKELATTVTESETYKTTLESFKPAKKETVAEPAKEEEVAKTEEAKTEETAAAIPTIETPAEEPKSETAAVATEEPKRRSASRKRTSIFGNLLGKKEEAKKEDELKPETAAATTEEPKSELAAAEPVTETPAVAASETPATEGAAVEAAPVEAAAEKTDAPVKPVPTKRASLFGGSFFGKKKAETESTPVSPATETAPVAEAAPVAENAPVIPAVETSAPLSAEVNSPATVPTETTDVTPAAGAAEPKKEMKSDKRKSSLPFLNKKEKAASSDEEGEKPKGGMFSKFRQTVKGKSSKPVEKSAEEKTAEETTATEAAKTEEPIVADVAKVEEPKVEEPTVAAPATEAAPVAEKPAAAAPVTAAA